MGNLFQRHQCQPVQRNACSTARVFEAQTHSPEAGVIEASCYERTPSVNRCGQIVSQSWDMNNRRLRINESGNAEVQIRYANGESTWSEVSSLRSGDKSRFAIVECTLRDGKLFDRQGNEVRVEKPLTDDQFHGQNFAVVWAASDSPLKGHRLVISKPAAPTKSTTKDSTTADAATLSNSEDYESSPSDSTANPIQRSPSDILVTSIPHQQVVLGERIVSRNRCGQTCYSYRNSAVEVGNDNGTLVVVDATGNNPQPLDLNRYGIRQVHFHEGRAYDAKTGREITLPQTVTAEQLAGKPFMQFRAQDGSHYFVTAGLPEGKSVELKQYSVPETFRDARGCCYQGRVYTLHRALVDTGTESRTYKLSSDHSSLSGFQPVQKGEVHPQFGTLRFTFRDGSNELIRVYESLERGGYDDRPVWTVAKRQDQFVCGRDACGRQQKQYSTTWVADPNLRISDPNLEYNPPARAVDSTDASTDAQSSSDSKIATLPTGQDPFAAASRSAQTQTDPDSSSTTDSERPTETEDKKLVLSRSAADEVKQAEVDQTLATDRRPAPLNASNIDDSTARPGAATSSGDQSAGDRSNEPAQNRSVSRAPVDPNGVDQAHAGVLLASVKQLLERTEAAKSAALSAGKTDQEFWAEHKSTFWKEYRVIREQQETRLEASLSQAMRELREGRLTQSTSEQTPIKLSEAEIVQLKRIADFYFDRADRKPHPELAVRSDLGAASGGDFFERSLYIAIQANGFAYDSETAPAESDPVHQAYRRLAAYGNSDFVLQEALGGLDRFDFTGARVQDSSYQEAIEFLNNTLQDLSRHSGSEAAPNTGTNPSSAAGVGQSMARDDSRRTPVLEKSIAALSVKNPGSFEGISFPPRS